LAEIPKFYNIQTLLAITKKNPRVSIIKTGERKKKKKTSRPYDNYPRLNIWSSDSAAWTCNMVMFKSEGTRKSENILCTRSIFNWQCCSPSKAENIIQHCCVCQYSVTISSEQDNIILKDKE
jgi:hypothetical protein